MFLFLLAFLSQTLKARSSLSIHLLRNGGTKYVDSKFIPKDPSTCGATTENPCTTIAQALTTDNNSANIIVLVTGEHEAESEASLFNRTVDITGNPNHANPEDAALRLAVADINGALFTVDAEVTFEQLQFIVILDTKFLLPQSFIETTSRANLTLMNLLSIHANITMMSMYLLFTP